MLLFVFQKCYIYSSMAGCVYYFLKFLFYIALHCLESNKTGVEAMHRERVAVIEASVLCFYLECIT